VLESRTLLANALRLAGEGAAVGTVPTFFLDAVWDPTVGAVLVSGTTFLFFDLFLLPLPPMQGTFGKSMSTVQFLLGEPRMILEFEQFCQYGSRAFMTVIIRHRAHALVSGA
jgi:hypothetical protein